MSTSDLERRIAGALQRRAEDAMENTDTEQQLDRLEHGIERVDARRRLIRWGGGVAVAAVAAGAAAIAWGGVGPRLEHSEPSVSDGSAQELPAREVAAAFLSAYESGDAAAVASWVGEDASPLILEDWQRLRRWNEATGFEYLWQPCRQDGAASTFWDAQTGSTQHGLRVVCPFAYHGLRSDDLGRGPYEGSSVTLYVEAGHVVQAEMDFTYENNGFSAQMWEPFADWVSRTHPRDAAVMYADWPSTTEMALTRAAAAVWTNRLDEYVAQRTRR